MAQVGIGIVVPIDGFCVMFAPEFIQQIREETFKISPGEISVDAVIWLDQWGKG